MNYTIVEDSELAKRNLSLITGSGGPAYNAVLSVTFSNESATEPVTLQEAKDWCRIDVTDDDTLITKLIKAARLICEHYVNMSFIARTVTAKIHNGQGDINLPYGPVTGAINYFELDGTTAIDNFDLTEERGDNFIAVYPAGYADGTLPEDLRTAILTQVAFMYENRGDAKIATGLSLESTIILQPLRNV